MVNGIVKLAVKALWAPVIWVVLLGLELLFVVDNPKPGLIVGTFEKLVMMLSFLFYNSRGIMDYQENPKAQIMSAFIMQFCFWWGAAFLILFLKKKLHKPAAATAAPETPPPKA